VLRNVASIGAFALSPLLMVLMIRALGPGGYGRWWSAFVVLEATGYLGMFASDLFVRREVARLTHEGRDDEVHAVVGSALAVVLLFGGSLAILAIVLSGPISTAQDDPELSTYLVILACQPLMSNVGAVLTAALQSRNILGAVAVLRGIVFPLITAAVFFIAWRLALPPWMTLVMMMSVTTTGLITVLVLYSLHLPLRRTLSFIVKPTQARAVFRYGGALILPIGLFVAGGKLDLYILGAHADAVLVGVYAGCLQMASGIPNIRALLDPVIQTQVGALSRGDRSELSASLRRLTRVCTFAVVPAFAMLVAIGEPVLGWMLGASAAHAGIPLIILAVGQLLASLAVASWIVPMMLRGRVLTVIAAATLVVKAILLLMLVPSFGLIGAAIATAVGTIISMQGQALTGAAHVGHRPYALSLLPMLASAALIGAGGQFLYSIVEPGNGQVMAVGISGATCLVCLGLVLGLFLDASEWAALRKVLGLAARDGATS